MKLRGDDNELISNVSNSKTFTIAATAKAFQILSSSLYERKIEAIVRELSCNAYDSHVQAGCPDKPFSIHLPTVWEPNFSIEDFGLGLSDTDVEDIYTSYFTSTKTDSNDVIGALGLGSKTPFSYTDTFNIRTRKAGIEYHYNAHISASGEPAVSLLSKHETEECNGVQITLPVNQKDFYEFKSCAEKVLAWFQVLPEFNTEIYISNDKAIKLKEEGIIFEEYMKNGYNKNFIVALMGNVAYRVSDVYSKFSEDFNKHEKEFFQNNGMYINFAIGDLDVAASRESISFDPETKKVFINTVKNAIKQYTQKTQDLVDACDSYVDAIEIINTEIGFWAYGMFTFKGADIYELANTCAISIIKQVQAWSGRVLGNKIIMCRGDKYKYYHFDEYNSFKIASHVTSTRKLVVVTNNQKNTNAVQRRVASQHENDSCLVFYCIDDVTEKFKTAMFSEFGNNVVYIDGRIIAEEIKQERALLRERNKKYNVAGSSSGSEKVKKAQVRIIEMITPKGRVDVKEVTDVDSLPERVVLFKSHYSVLDGQFSTDGDDLHFLCVALNLDAILICKGQSYERNLRELGDKAVDEQYCRNTRNHNHLLILDCFLIERIKVNETKFLNDLCIDRLPNDHILNVVSARIKGYNIRLPSQYTLHSIFSYGNSRDFYHHVGDTMSFITKRVWDDFVALYPMISFVSAYSLRQAAYDDKNKMFEYIDMVDKLITLQTKQPYVNLQNVA